MSKTILVTGGTGYIGSWVTKKLLEKGYTVRLTVRNKNKTTGYAHLQTIADANPGQLEIWEADLLMEGSFDAPAKGADAIMHIASPFILDFKDAQKDLIDPALKGTQNVLQAANRSGTVQKIILTSSAAAVYGDNIDMKEQGLNEFTEDHFNDTSSLQHQPYSYSKVLAEKEAWKMVEQQDQWKLVVINPSFVMGPTLNPLGDSESLKVMKNILTGKYNLGAPALMYGFVDVRDVADAHILALENESAAGRHILAERTDGLYELTQIIKNLFGNKYKLPIMKTPKPMMYLVGWMFGMSVKFIRRNIDHPLKFNNTKSVEKLGLKYTPLPTTLKDMIHQMERDNMV